jgi:cobalt-zinc-cadmium efflux system outer membrane protein
MASHRMKSPAIMCIALLLVGATGCASVNLSAGFPAVSATVEERTAAKIAYNARLEPDEETTGRLRSLLQRKLTADDVAQVALVNNRDLQAMYSDLGVAQADLVQAGLLKNPVLDASVLFHLGPVRPDIQLGVVFGLLEALYIPLRKRVVAAQFEEAKLRVTGGVLDFVLEVRHAFYAHQANEQLLDLRKTVAQALVASFEASRRLHQAGNITDLDLTRDRAAMERSRLALRSAEVNVRQSRERLNSLMGLFGSDTEWAIEERLPDVAPEPVRAAEVERDAIARSIDLGHAKQRIATVGERLGYDRATALIPSTEIGASAEKESDEPWGIGPSVSVPIPIFDQGQARIARASAELRRAQHEYHAIAVRIRATSRALVERVRGAGDRALYYRDIVLPLHERIVSEAQLQYNAMQVGIFDLLRDRQEQIEAAVEYVEILREYWMARADLLHLMSGRLPAADAAPPAGTAGKRSVKENGNGQ